MILKLKQQANLQALIVPLSIKYLMKSENMFQKNVNLGIIIEIKIPIFVL